MATPYRRTFRTFACAAGFASALLISWLAAKAVAQPIPRNTPRERRIEQQLEAIAPGAVPLFKAATAAMDKGDHAEAARLFQQVVEQAPEFSPALRRLGSSLVDIGQREAGLNLVSHAVQLERSPENLATMAYALTRPVNGQQPSSVFSSRRSGLHKKQMTRREVTTT